VQQYPRDGGCYSFLRPDHTCQYFKRIEGNRNAGAVPENNVYVRNGLFFTTVDAYLPVVFTVSSCHDSIVV
jgi:hypothetical protein